MSVRGCECLYAPTTIRQLTVKTEINQILATRPPLGATATLLVDCLMPLVPHRYQPVAQDDKSSEATLEVEEPAATAKGTPDNSTTIIGLPSLKTALIVLALVPASTIVAATANALAVLLSRGVFLSSDELYFLPSGGAIFALSFLGALIQCAPSVPLVAFLVHLIGERHERAQWLLAIFCGSVLSLLPFAMGVAVLPHAVPEGFAVAHVLQLCGWALMPLAVVVGFLGALGAGCTSILYCCKLFGPDC
ncbi:hypothetical protein C8Q79DRAFT_521240 [Trametes meyenii]|nr:hypothetical protein C8Q79DRAFT_521240 [Trametes meyenii]